MALKDTLETWLPAARRQLAGLELEPRLEQIGRVESVGDGIATVSGLPDTRAEEILIFAGGVLGMAHSLDAAAIGCILFGDDAGIAAGDVVHGTGTVVQVPVGPGLLGRVVDAVGRPLDDGPAVEAERHDPVERDAPAIVDRDFVTEPLHTGVLVVDAMFALGRGQRELIIGDRSTGKTAIAIDAIISQRASDVISVYVAVGQKSSGTRQVIEAVRRGGAIDRCLFVVAAADSPPGLQWLAPFAGMTMAEYFRDRGRHVLLVIDDLTKHAAIHRELALLLRQPPGREAYPGDIFHLHARLLERSAKLAEARGGGSLPALPIAETQAGNLSAYIPTNLISITDGQIVLDTRLFYEGHKPAVDAGRSVSRVGGKTQTASLRGVSSTLRLDYAQFLELESFTRFGAVVDERTRAAIEHGRRVRGVLEQVAEAPLTLGLEVALLAALGAGVLDTVPVARIGAFKARLGPWLEASAKPALAHREAGGELGDARRAEIVAAAKALAAILAAEKASAP